MSELNNHFKWLKDICVDENNNDILLINFGKNIEKIDINNSSWFRRTIKYKDELYYLIEEKGQIEKILSEKRTIKYDLSNHIFLIDFKLDFPELGVNSIKKVIDFNCSIFKKSFLIKRVFFENFFSASWITFLRWAEFKWSYFRNIDLVDSVFYENLTFFDCNINWLLNITNISWDFKLNVFRTYFETIDYINSKIDKVESRNVFTILKNYALKQNDNIWALDFHLKEMSVYSDELFKDWKRWYNSLDWFILWFEKISSNFWINPWRWIFIILLFNLILFWIFVYFSKSY